MAYLLGKSCRRWSPAFPSTQLAALNTKPSYAHRCVELVTTVSKDCEELLTADRIQRERLMRMEEIEQLKKENAASALKGTARARRTLIRSREYDVMRLWDAEMTVMWMEHARAAVKAREQLRLAIADVAKEIGSPSVLSALANSLSHPGAPASLPAPASTPLLAGASPDQPSTSQLVEV